ncbi:MAG: hypothetical protein ACTSRS_10365 [Candidatus Helarchaeota archaeon]
MKLIDLSRNTLKILQEAGEKGINYIELADKLTVPRRRIYDIIAILRATDLIEVNREKGGTRVFWKTLPDIEQAPSIADDTKLAEKYKAELTKLEKENSELKERIKHLHEDLSKGSPKTVEKKLQFDTNEIAVRAAKSLKITEVVSSGIEVIIKASGKGIIVEPLSKE